MTKIETLQSDGIDRFLPALVFPERRDVMVLAGMPEWTIPRLEIQRVLKQHGPPSAFIFAVRTGESVAKAGSCEDGRCEFAAIDQIRSGFVARPVKRPDW